MNRIVLVLLAAILSVSTVTFAQLPFPTKYRENAVLVKKANCAGIIISRYEKSDYALNEYLLPDGDMLFLVIRNSERESYFRGAAGSSDTVLIPFAEAKARYTAALHLPVPDAIPICTPIPTGDNTK